MRLTESPVLPSNPQTAYDNALRFTLAKLLREISQKVNQLASGTLAGSDLTATAVPASGTWAKGDYVRKSNPVEAGGAGAKYVILGWVRITDGTGNTLNTDWLECRALTGN